jgi:hypothetical protein
VKFAQRSFFAGEKLAGLADGQRRVGGWRRVRAGMRARGSTRQRPAVSRAGGLTKPERHGANDHQSGCYICMNGGLAN